MASGLPVVAFNYAAAARFIRHGENGWLVPLNDRAAFISAAVHVASDSALRARLGPAARQTAERISWDFVLDHLEHDFAAVLAAHKNNSVISSAPISTNLPPAAR